MLLDVYGVSYHYRLDVFVDSLGRERKHNQVNPGVGARFEFLDRHRQILGVITGLYKDSGYEIAQYAGLAYKVKLWSGTHTHLALGLDAGRIWTPTYEEKWVALPLVSVRHRKVALNVIWLPHREAPALALSASFSLRH